MKQQSQDGAKSLVLIGGGHAHVLVMLDFARRPPPRTRLILVSENELTPYSGMLPGYIAGLYSFDEIHINLARLARAANVHFVQGKCTGLDRSQKLVKLEGGPDVPYDLASINVGITPDLSRVTGASEFAIAVKPVSDFLSKVAALSRVRRPVQRVAIIGGGAAGVELAFALLAKTSRLWEHTETASQIEVSLITSGSLVPRLNAGARSKIQRQLQERGVRVLCNSNVVKIEEGRVFIDDGRIIEADAILISTHAKPPAWIESLGLPQLPDGSIATRPTLQVEGDDDVFAVGDCATIRAQPREKAGVFAVRQAPTLVNNLRARLQEEPLRDHKSQRAFLALLMTGDGSAIAARGRFMSAQGSCVWRLKDHIDRKFMAQFNRA
jgi:pyridine nucleotide-disulfide oxidoreductase family protein